jgi:hypothetical protein
VSGDLLSRVGQRIKRLVDIFADYLVLDRDYRGEKDVVFGFGFDANVELLDAKGDVASILFARAADYAQAWLDEAVIK